MWFAGSYCQRFKNLTASDIALSTGVMALATFVAFFISNTSFYVLSGRPVELSWAQYLDGYVQFFPTYFSSALIYGVVGLLVIKLFRAIPSLIENHKAV
jgi:hypothetical protein